VNAQCAISFRTVELRDLDNAAGVAFSQCKKGELLLRGGHHFALPEGPNFKLDDVVSAFVNLEETTLRPEEALPNLGILSEAAKYFCQAWRLGQPCQLVSERHRGVV
jgi:hypothetical protein